MEISRAPENFHDMEMSMGYGKFHGDCKSHGHGNFQVLEISRSHQNSYKMMYTYQVNTPPGSPLKYEKENLSWAPRQCFPYDRASFPIWGVWGWGWRGGDTGTFNHSVFTLNRSSGLEQISE